MTGRRESDMTHGLEFGVDWYPEQWDESRWAQDAERMAAYGFSVVRIMEFAWTLVEPEPGRFDFSLFDRAIAVLSKCGIKAIVGTPTATPPVWLVDAHPDVLRVSPLGPVHDFGARRNACYNAPDYWEAALRIAGAVARHYGGDPRVAGFQVDNEIGHEGSDRCVCNHCRTAWHAWLGEKYGDPVALNAAWGAVFWNTSYARFDQVPVPRVQPATGHNPGLLLDYDRFCSDAAASFALEQTSLLRGSTSPEQYITTNLFPPPFSHAIDMEDLTEGMDFASWDNYPTWGPQDQPFPWAFNAAAESYVRGLHDNSPFTVMEAMSGIQGHVSLGYLPPERQVALWSIQAIARGAERIVFFRWRTAPYGREQLCYGLLDPDDRETERLRVLVAMMKRAKSELGDIAQTRIESHACLAYSRDDA
ncbi:MAG: beta-galactosidase, partial [Spirochaetales bacterium]